MKKFEKRLRIRYNALIAGLLTLLGFASSCEKGDIGGPVVCMYGSPSAKFIVNGKVESSLTNEPVQNIRVIIKGDSVTTEADGSYIVKTAGFPITQTFKIQFQDIDSTLNGQFQNLDTAIVFKDPLFTNGDGWYRGETSKEFNIKLKPKK